MFTSNNRIGTGTVGTLCSSIIFAMLVLPQNKNKHASAKRITCKIEDIHLSSYEFSVSNYSVQRREDMYVRLSNDSATSFLSLFGSKLYSYF